MTRPGEFSPATVQLIWDRDRGCCVVCGRGLRRERRGEPFNGWSVMHREPRGAGGVKRNSDRPHLVLPSNGALGCGTGTTGCHADVEAGKYPAEDGYKVSRLGKARPADVPLRHALFGMVRLDDAGGWETAA
ncbi:hypothetical protein [Microbacterium sp. Leaf203]|uniref:hypothetical protein n=1 Tax=Microbacterium sp. Leaf203 TaxID=1735677 RepID=UPI0006F29BA4|nr:hypothetical protein [Microbacterium sp. Leaf203]KQM38406.1 hypothetical protein ASE56_14080 [Microbacterium sp. Leaf203]